MPCNSDHMEPHADEIERREAAQILIFIYEQERIPIPDNLKDSANHMYGEGRKEVVYELCDLLQKQGNAWLEQFAREHILNSKTALLLKWWHKHATAEGRYYNPITTIGDGRICRGDFIIYWTGRPHKDIPTSIKYQRGEWNSTFVGKAKDSWLALQFATSLGAGAEIKLYEVSLISFGKTSDDEYQVSDYDILGIIEGVILKHFDPPREPGAFILAKHRKPHSTQ